MKEIMSCRSMIDRGCMKSFMVDGVWMCSYRTIKVSHITGSSENAHIEKDCFCFSIHELSQCIMICVDVFRLYYDQAAAKLLWV